MRILVCGGRDFTDHVTFNRWMARFVSDYDGEYDDNTVIIHGGAKGADTLAGLFAKMFGLKCEVYYANLAAFGNSAGPIRNHQMLDEGKPDYVVAFKGGKGTAHMVKIAQEAGLKVLLVG